MPLFTPELRRVLGFAGTSFLMLSLALVLLTYRFPLRAGAILECNEFSALSEYP